VRLAENKRANKELGQYAAIPEGLKHQRHILVEARDYKLLKTETSKYPSLGIYT
jgi:hypothetical protein